MVKKRAYNSSPLPRPSRALRPPSIPGKRRLAARQVRACQSGCQLAGRPCLPETDRLAVVGNRRIELEARDAFAADRGAGRVGSEDDPFAEERLTSEDQ